MIRLEGVGKTYPDGTVAVHELDLDVPHGAIVCLVGPSGCGKSTTLKMVNRLIEPTTGRIYLDGVDVTDADPVELRRGIGYVIQQVGLFPHQVVLTNVMTVPLLYGESKAAAKTRAEELMHLVGLDPAEFADRYPHQLSGGQRQRVGVARALAADPPVLLMDEPFGAVDPVVRSRLQDEFLRLQRDLGKTVLMVTHDIDEAVKMGDRVAVFAEGGRLAQYDEPAAVLGAPADEFVAEFVGGSRGLRRLSVTSIDPDHLESMEGVNACGPRRHHRRLLHPRGRDGLDDARGQVDGGRHREGARPRRTDPQRRARDAAGQREHARPLRLELSNRQARSSRFCFCLAAVFCSVCPSQATRSTTASLPSACSTARLSSRVFARFLVSTSALDSVDQLPLGAASPPLLIGDETLELALREVRLRQSLGHLSRELGVLGSSHTEQLAIGGRRGCPVGGVLPTRLQHLGPHDPQGGPGQADRAGRREAEPQRRLGRQRAQHGESRQREQPDGDRDPDTALTTSVA